MMNSGYDPDPVTGKYDTPPIAPQMFHSYHVAGQHAVIATIGALLYRHGTGRGQYLSTAVHEAISKNTEIDVPAWIYQRQPLFRQTCRHASSQLTPSNICQTKDGRYFMIRTNVTPRLFTGLLEMLQRYGRASDLADPQYQDPAFRDRPEIAHHINDVVHRFFSQSLFEGPWHEAQAAGQVCAPLRKPEENPADAHWQARNTFQEVEHPGAGPALHLCPGPLDRRRCSLAQRSPGAPPGGEPHGQAGASYPGWPGNIQRHPKERQGEALRPQQRPCPGLHLVAGVGRRTQVSCVVGR